MFANKVISLKIQLKAHRIHFYLVAQIFLAVLIGNQEIFRITLETAIARLCKNSVQFCLDEHAFVSNVTYAKTMFLAKRKNALLAGRHMLKRYLGILITV